MRRNLLESPPARAHASRPRPRHGAARVEFESRDGQYSSSSSWSSKRREERRKRREEDGFVDDDDESVDSNRGLYFFSRFVVVVRSATRERSRRVSCRGHHALRRPSSVDTGRRHRVGASEKCRERRCGRRQKRVRESRREGRKRETSKERERERVHLAIV